MFAVGAGRIGAYDCCCWQVMGEGQFKALPGSDAYSGDIGELSREAEYQVEMVCHDEIVSEVVDALKQTHPYEEVAYAVWQLSNL